MKTTLHLTEETIIQAGVALGAAVSVCLASFLIANALARSLAGSPLDSAGGTMNEVPAARIATTLPQSGVTAAPVDELLATATASGERALKGTRWLVHQELRSNLRNPLSAIAVNSGSGPVPDAGQDVERRKLAADTNDRAILNTTREMVYQELKQNVEDSRLMVEHNVQLALAATRRDVIREAGDNIREMMLGAKPASSEERIASLTAPVETRESRTADPALPKFVLNSLNTF